jgi:hypothetical protein
MPANITSIGLSSSSLAVKIGGVAIDKGEGAQLRQLAGEALAQIAAEAGLGIGRDADIFVEMKRGDARPVDVLHGREMVQHLELAGAGRDDDVGVSTFGDTLCNRRASEVGSRHPTCHLGIELVGIDHA